MKKLTPLFTVFAMVAWTAPASAVIVSFDVVGGGNDCAGYYSSPRGFDSCVIFAEDLGKGAGDISSVVAKWEGGWQVSTLYPTFDAGDVDLSGSSLGAGSGSFTYSGPDFIRFWVAKGGGGRRGDFRVFYETSDASCVGAASTFSCMSGASFLTFGTTYSWSTAMGGLSHLTFYDTEVREMSEPGTLALLGLGMIGLGLARRRREVVAS